MPKASYPVFARDRDCPRVVPEDLRRASERQLGERE